MARETGLEIMRRVLVSYVETSSRAELIKLARCISVARPGARSILDWLTVISDPTMPEGPIPAPVALCEELHDELVAVEHILRYALARLDNVADRADIRRHKTNVERLRRQLAAQHVPMHPVTDVPQ